MPTGTYALPNVNTSRTGYTHFIRGILRERELTHRTFQNFLQKNGRRHVGLQFYACASCSPAHPLRSPSAVSPLSLAACTSRYIALKQLPIDQLSFTSIELTTNYRHLTLSDGCSDVKARVTVLTSKLGCSPMSQLCVARKSSLYFKTRGPGTRSKRRVRWSRGSDETTNRRT